MKITKRQLQRIIKEAVDQNTYELGREDSFAGISPQLPDKDYMMGYNEAQVDAGLPTIQSPSDSGSGKKLDPSLLKHAVIGSPEDRGEMADYIARLEKKRMEMTERHLRKSIRASLLKEVKMQGIITNPYEDVEDYNIIANYALANDIDGALADPALKPYVEKNEMAWIADEAIGWFEQVGKATDLPAPEGWDIDKAHQFLKDLEDAAWKVYDKQATAAISSDPDKEFLEFLGNQWSSMIEPNDMEGIKWKEYKKYIRLKPPPSISHGVGEIHITREDTETLYPGAWEDFKDFLATRAGGAAGNRKAYKRSPAPYYD
jgi:hypothetical protein